VKKVIITSSCASIYSNDFPKLTFNETDWPSEIKKSPYEISKLRAEKAAWDYWNSLPEDTRFQLVTLLPGYV
jgi:nucleoside-diphosphate-sugar epimerase